MPTAPTGLRDRRKAATRDRILDETRDLLEAMPPSRFTLAEVAANAGVSVRTPYRYFPDGKTEILLEVCRIRPFSIDTSDHPEVEDPPHPDYLLAAKCFTYLGAPWLGAMIGRISDGELADVEAAAHAARQIIERGRNLARAQAQEARS